MLRGFRESFRNPHGGIRVHPESDEEVIHDPRFGLLSLRKYTKDHLSNLFLSTLIPVQWILYACILFQPREICPQGISKVSFLSICLLYATRVPHLWMQYKKGRDLSKRSRPSWSSLLDCLHEHGLKISVFLTNLILIAAEEPLDQVLNCVALEFLSEIDNLYQEQIVEQLQIKEEIYKDFISPEEVEESLRKKGCLFKLFYRLTGIFLSLFALLILLLYPFILILVFWGIFC